MRPKIILPQSFSRRGLAFEELVRRLLLIYFGYEGIFSKSYLRSASGRWTQLDSILVKKGRAYLLEVKFQKSPLSSMALLPKINFARQLGCSGLLLVTLKENSGNFFGNNLDGFVANLLWEELYAPLSSNYSNCYLTRDVEPLERENSRFFSRNGNSLEWQADLLSAEGEFAVVPDDVERWLRRLPIMKGSSQLYVDKEGKYQFKTSDELAEGIKELIAIEEALSGFSATHPPLLANCGLALAESGAATPGQVHRQLIFRGRRVLPQAVSAALTDLKLMGLVEVNHCRQFMLTSIGREVFTLRKMDYLAWQRAFITWKPRSAIRASGLGYTRENLNAVREYFERIYLPFRPYLKNLFNLNKLRGMLDLSMYIENKCSQLLPKGRYLCLKGR